MSAVPNIPSTGVQTNENYALISGYDIYDRAFRKKLGAKVPRAQALSWMRYVKGYMSKRTTPRHQYYYYEEGQWMSASATIQSVVDGTTYVDITLSAADHTDTGTSSFPVVGQTVVFENEVTGYVYSVNRTVASAHSVRVYPVDPTINNILASAVPGQAMVFYSNGQQERSTGTETRVPKVTKVTNYIQTFREAYEVTDHAKQNQVEFSYNGQQYLYPKGIDEMMDRFATQEELGLLINYASGALLNANGKAIRLAKGFIPQITDSGNTLEYFGTPDMTTIDDAILILNRNYAEHEYAVGQGLDANLGWKNWLIEFASAGDNNISFNAFDGGKEQALNFNFKSISIEPYSFHFNTWDVFSHSDTLGAGGMPYRNMIGFIPLGKTKNPEGGQGNDMEPYISLVYSDPGGAPHQNKGDYCVFSEGALSPGGATNDTMYWKIHAVSYKSLEMRCLNKFLIVRRAA
jgi:hypothetical protein